MDRWVGKVAIVTGASAGIGLEIVKSLVRRGMIVVGLARRKEKMEVKKHVFTENLVFLLTKKSSCFSARIKYLNFQIAIVH